MQPVPFSHYLPHAGQLGLDCRYCHSNVEQSGHANIPTAQTCMNCHSQLKTTSPLLAVVRRSYETGDALVPWVWIPTRLPDYVYFNHAIHVNRGVSCALERHGRVDQMDTVNEVKSLAMGFCPFDRHRGPADHLRPTSEVTNSRLAGRQPGGPGGASARSSSTTWKVNPSSVPATCSGCHR